MSPELDIIIVNWNAGRQLGDCLDSIATASRRGFTLKTVAVIDNCSTDTSLNALQRDDLPLTLIRNQTNRGFAAACNQGAYDSTADYLLFLNPDTMVYSDSLAVPIAFMAEPQNRAIGICGIQLVDDRGHVSRTCARFPETRLFIWKILGLNKFFPRVFQSHYMTEWNHDSNRIVDQVMGAFFMVRRSVFEQLDGFDERFFVYFEEVDFSYRAWNNGWRSIYLTDVRAYHRGGGTSHQVKAHRLYYSLRSRIYYGFKHFGRVSAVSLLAVTTVLEPVSRMVYAAIRGSVSEMRETVAGYVMLYRDLLGFHGVLTRACMRSEHPTGPKKQRAYES